MVAMIILTSMENRKQLGRDILYHYLKVFFFFSDSGGKFKGLYQKIRNQVWINLDTKKVF